ncbi:hypothetical protein [Paenibacillus sp. YN15]|uniref:hypothetical protein n=1 Tax=Paenibacillus sp. YN15 TaxID=1742774 RepID=UPI000DCB1E36|nr:hypothetical protein [Paenibacillus sp. YN15]RAV02422.1 hypothetical protein DQG13_10390 [Paenibacillus sp. YN15]
MFDPTIYENVKIVMEGAVYDMDLGGLIQVTAREDLVDLASLSRTFRIAFRTKPDAGGYTAWMELSSSLSNMAAEILEQPEAQAGCSIMISFTAALSKGANPQTACEKAERAIRAVWGEQYRIEQQITHSYSQGQEEVRHTVRLLFGRTFTEAVIDDLPELAAHTDKTLGILG